MPAVCYVLVGVGFGLMVPAGSTAAMAQVPPDFSGIGSGLFNACLEIGTAMGLAILGSIATSVIIADWHRRAGSLPPAERQPASQLAADVAGGQAHLVAASAGQNLLDPAIASFLSGFEAVLLLAGVILAAAGMAGHPGPPAFADARVPATAMTGASASRCPDSGQGHHSAVTERFERHQARSRADDGEPVIDHFLGWLPGADGRHDLTYLSTDGNYYPNYRLAPDFQGCGYSDPDHSWEGFLIQHNFGKMDGFLQRPTAPADNPGVTLAKANTFPIG